MALNWFAISEGEKEREYYQLIITKLSSYTFSVKRKLPSFPSIRLLRHRRTSGDAKLTSSNNTHQPFRTASTRAPYTHTHTQNIILYGCYGYLNKCKSKISLWLI